MKMARNNVKSGKHLFECIWEQKNSLGAYARTDDKIDFAGFHGVLIVNRTVWLLSLLSHKL